ncbi:MAG: hypothetical protein D3908_11300 [Candidatus Electrothrix sp. AUS4]|nr:hypothetical protein [Candidatus Electrothrix sp. AUS4]
MRKYIIFEQELGNEGKEAALCPRFTLLYKLKENSANDQRPASDLRIPAKSRQQGQCEKFVPIFSRANLRKNFFKLNTPLINGQLENS